MKQLIGSFFVVALLSTTQAIAGDTTSTRLASVLAGQPEDVQARYTYRHPQETLEFFGVAPGMTVLEALPGRGWYSKLLLTYIGSDGTLAGVDYNKTLFPNFGFYGEEQLKAKETWAETWTKEAEAWGDDNDANVTAFTFGTMPDSVKGTADVVLFIRALHNLARFESKGSYLTEALRDAVDALKPGGIVGVVQHEARGEMPDDWADGSHGYIKKAFVIAVMEKAGLEYVGEIAINNNINDKPTTDDLVWRLPPTLMTSRENAELREQLIAVGESNRMTLKFRKPE